MSTNAIQVDPSNVDALHAWDGPDGDYWAENQAVFDHSLHRYGPRFFEAAAIETTDRVLDVGCGTGGTAREAARRASAGSVLGVDLSASMLEVARRLSADAGLSNVDFLQADAQVHPFDNGAFDVAISRTGAMFFGDPVAALANVGRALREDGRLVLLVWQAPDDNHWFRDFTTALALDRPRPTPPPGVPGPFTFADPERLVQVLTDAGLVDVQIEGVREPMWFGADAEAAYRFVTGQGFTTFMMKDLDFAQRERALADLRASIDAHETDDGVLYPSAAWIAIARATPQRATRGEPSAQAR